MALQHPDISNTFINVDTPEKLTLFNEAVRNSLCKYLAFDTETTGLGRDAKVFGFVVTLGNPIEADAAGNQLPKNTYWYRFDRNHPQIAAMNEVAVDLIRWIFHECDKIVIMHNMVFDIRVVRQTWGIVFDGPKFNDTYIMAEVLRRHPRSGLKELGARILKNHDRWDNIVKEWFKDNKYRVDSYKYQDVPDSIMFPYAACDGELTYRLFFALRAEFAYEPESLQAIYALEKQIIPVTAEMEFNGMCVHLPYFRQTAMIVDQKLNELLEHFFKLWGPDFNPRSAPQMRKVLYGTDKEKNQLGLPAVKRTASGAESTDVHSLEVHAQKNETVRHLLTYSRLNKMQTAFVQAILYNAIETSPGVFTIHTSYRQILDTGRYSSSRMNLQQIPNDNFSRGYGQIDGGDVSIRRGFIAPPGQLYTKFDYAAFELRLLGNASGDQLFIDMVKDDVDMHSWLAAELYRDELDTMEFEPAMKDKWFAQMHDNPLSKKWSLTWKYWAVKSKATKDLKYMRTMVKVCSFEIYYGAGPRKIALTHGISVGLAEHLRNICYGTFTGVKRWRDQIVSTAGVTNRVYTMFGRQRKLDPDKIYTTAVNTIIQGTAADILKFAMRDIHLLMKGRASKLIATIHDEVQCYIHPDELYLVPQIIECMETRRLPRETFPLDMLCEASATTINWSSMQDIHGRGEALIPEIKALIEGERNEPQGSKIGDENAETVQGVPAG